MDADDEERRLRSVAMQNAQAILLARQRAERDVLEAKEALERKTEELAHSLAMMRATLESTTDAIVVTNAEAEITGFNHRFMEMWGIPRELMEAREHRPVVQLVSRLFEDPNSFCHRVEQIYADSPPETDDRLELADGRVIERFSRTQWIEERNVGRVWSFRDITERTRTERALEQSYRAEQEARAAAEQANKAKDHFLAALSHELRTPLTPVLAILSHLRQEAALPESVVEDLETVRRNVELEARLIDDLLDLTRITRGMLHLHSEHVSAERVMEDAIQTCLPDLHAKRLKLRRELVEPAPTLEVDSARVTQILWNLLKNAIKFTPAEGTITIRSRIEDGGGHPELVVQVQDTGIGMDPRDLERVFTAFEQADGTIGRQFGGLGLGLAISKAIAESHRGTLRAASAGKGQGSVFTLRLPCAECGPGEPTDLHPSRAISSTPVAPLAPSVVERPLRILLVEDHADTAAILCRLLRRMGHDVMHADCILQAHEIADREMQGGRLDLLMSDLGLPDGSGQDLMRTLGAKYSLRGIALSGYGMDADVEQSAAAGFSRHLTKPIDVTVLRSTITELMLD
jgi:PAS domain S-box-containing protein